MRMLCQPQPTPQQIKRVVFQISSPIAVFVNISQFCSTKVCSKIVTNACYFSVQNDKDVQYVLKRLVRSLGANLPDMRTGYFATLVALLSNFEKVTIPQVLELIKKELHSNGSSKSVSIFRNSYLELTDQFLKSNYPHNAFDFYLFLGSW